MRCVPCRSAALPMDAKAVRQHLRHIPKWRLNDASDRISREFVFKEFAPAMKFVNQVAKLAEREGHHPDFVIHYNKVELILWTHRIGGLHENDFILAAKIDELT